MNRSFVKARPHHPSSKKPSFRRPVRLTWTLEMHYPPIGPGNATQPISPRWVTDLDVLRVKMIEASLHVVTPFLAVVPTASHSLGCVLTMTEIRVSNSATAAACSAGVRPATTLPLVLHASDPISDWRG